METNACIQTVSLKKGRLADKIPVIVQTILADDDSNCIQKIYLFGSYAYGRPNKCSDIDIFVIIDNINNKLKLYGKLYGKILKLMNNDYNAFDLLLQRCADFELGLKENPQGVESIINNSGVILYAR